MSPQTVRYAVAFLLASAIPALAAPNCKALAAEAARLEAEMGAIGRQVADTANARAARRQGMAAGSMIASGISQFVPMGGLIGQGMAMAQRAEVHGARVQMDEQMSRMRTASARLTEIEMQRARRCGE
jgi:hypothetical protein